MDKQEKGIVVATRGRMFEVRAEDGSRLKCEVRRKVKDEIDSTTPVAVGDRVLVSHSHAKAGMIEKVFPRETSFHRPGVYVESQKQVIAANLDRLAIVVSMKSPELKTGLIDRFLIAARNGDLEPFIVINKMDLEKPEDLDDIIAGYRSIDIPVFPTSALTGEGIKAVEQHLCDHLSLFAGHSGVGKTSLLNRMDPALDQKTKEISAATDRGKHATTNIELFELPKGGFFVDSPGLKVLGLWDVDKDDLPYYYPEFEKYRDRCRFSPCSHTHEPDCAVQAAVKKGDIPGFRYGNYLAIYQDLK